MYIFRSTMLILCIAVIFLSQKSYSRTERDWVDGELITYCEDGIWAWFQDERVVVDTLRENLIVGSANFKSGVDFVIYDIKKSELVETARFDGLPYSVDYNAPAVLVCPSGDYLAMWAHHYDKYFSHYSIFSDGAWSPEHTFDWEPLFEGIEIGISYSNLCYLSKKKRIYNFARANERAPHFIYSDDNGATWEYGGQIATNDHPDSYSTGYFKYWSNGIDRIEVVCVEEHPRDYTNSIYHGYIQGGQLFNSHGDLADSDIYSRESIADFNKLTKVFAHGTEIDGVHMGRCWQHDVARYSDGTVAILFKARANNNFDDHRNFYARFDGTDWTYTYIGKAGERLYFDEQDYTGLGSLNPDDPNRIYLSTAYNPGDDAVHPASRREIWRGTTDDHGVSWSWEPVTANSLKDNIRPVVPKWKPGKEAVLWCRGRYNSASYMPSKIVGTFYEYEPPPVSCDGYRHSSGTLSGSSSDAVQFRQTSHRVILECRTAVQTPLQVTMFSLSGKIVATYVNSQVVTGYRHITWDTRDVPAGIYIVKVAIGNKNLLHRVRVHGR